MEKYEKESTPSVIVKILALLVWSYFLMISAGGIYADDHTAISFLGEALANFHSKEC